MATNCPEYQTIVQCTSDLLTAMKPTIHSLSGDLLQAGLITSDNYGLVTNVALDGADRASQLLSFIRNKISLDKNNYYIFIHILSRRSTDYREIISILHKKYMALGE